MNDLNNKTMLELLELKEYWREKYGLYIENDMGERGSFNHKTKPYWGCVVKKRIKHSSIKGRKCNAHLVYQTFDSYREALIFCLERAEDVNSKL